MKKIALLVAVFIATFLSGCASSPKDWFKPDNPVAEITIQAATLKYIDGESEKAQGLLSFANQAKGYLEGSPQARAAEAVVILKSFIPWEKLSEEEQLLATAAFGVIQVELEKRIEEGGLNEDARLYLSDILNWVIRTCEAYINAPDQVRLWQEGQRDRPLLASSGGSPAVLSL